jgi:serine/threonine protein kinase/nitrite reductase/ring-hydroxylating ferredoxin subunit
MENVVLDQYIGQTIDNCHIEQVVSRGHMSVVYRAQQLQSKRPVAFMLFQLLDNISPIARQQFCARFAREAPSLMRLSHPHLLPFYGYGEWEGSPYLITPYRTEGSLTTRIKQQGSWSPAQILPLLEQVVAALEYTHRNGLLHGMLTPANLLLSKDGSLEIAAIGLQRLVERRGIFPCTTPSECQLSLAGTALCAPKYLAPEYRQGHAATIRSDIYSLGVIILELLQGRFLAQNIYPHEFLDQPDWSPPLSLQHVLYRTLAEDPHKRFKRVSDVLTAYAEQVETSAEVDMPEVNIVEENLPYSFSSTPPSVSLRPVATPIPSFNQKTDTNQKTNNQVSENGAWTERDFIQKWSPPRLPSRPSPAFTTAIEPPRPLRLLSPLDSSPARKISRRRTTALLAGGLVAAIAGIGGIGLGQLLSAGGKTTQTATNGLPPGGIGQTGQAPNTAVAFIDTSVPDHRQRLLIHLPTGNFIAYKQGCTHTGVLVNYDPKTKLLVCPAHGAIFDPAQGGKVIKGPATTPLPQVAIKVSASGVIMLA